MPLLPTSQLTSLTPSDKSPHDRLLILQGFGLPDRQLLEAALGMLEDLGEVLLALPMPLERSLALLDAQEGERALLGFTVREILTSPHAELLPRDFQTAPDTLRGLYQAQHPRLHQILYLGALLCYPADPSKWERVSDVMQRLGHPQALPPQDIPSIPYLSFLYDTAPSSAHPFLFFSKKPVALCPFLPATKEAP